MAEAAVHGTVPPSLVSSVADSGRGDFAYSGFADGRLTELVEHQMGGGTPSRRIPSYWSGDIPWASVKDFSDEQTELRSTEESITASGLHASTSNLIPAGIPLVCTRMAVGRVAIGAVPVAINQDVRALFPKPGVDARYLLRLLQYAQPKAEAVSVGSTVKGIGVQDYLALTVPRAPLREQPEIARVLDTLDTAIHKTEAIIAKLKQVKQGLLHDLLTRGIDANGELRPPQSEAPHLYKPSPLGWIPREWGVESVGDVTSDSTIGPFGSDLVASDYRTSGVPVVFVRDVKPGQFTWISNVFVDKGKAQALFAHNVRVGDVVATKMGLPPCVAATYPQSMPDGVITADIVRLRPRVDRIRALWLSTFINSAGVTKQVERITAGVTRPKVTLRDVRGLLVGVLGLDEQDRILSRLAAVESRVRKEDAERAKLVTQKSGLMDDLLTGRVRVTPLLEAAGVP